MKSIRDTMKDHKCYVYDLFLEDDEGAKQELEQTEPYFFTLQLRALPGFCAICQIRQNRYFDQQAPDSRRGRKIGYIVVTGRQGSCGCLQSQCHQNGGGTSLAGKTISCLWLERLAVSILRKQKDVGRTQISGTRCRSRTMHRARLIFRDNDGLIPERGAG